ncbi:2,3-diaminopropionate biosynthesis protein SbnA [Actinosynnema sp. CS-041913]|uniref:2,3-diaminopropionate biosynthesis protein SbnA n=1 Tax=Actinosynnema sp. CS-041913 TaxID=3239917 RepID=UPI003D9040BB
MPIIAAPQDFHADDLFVDFTAEFGLYLKCEGFNFAGSIKLKAAQAMIAAAERDGLLGPRSVIVESSSGNLGVALAVLAADQGYDFLCVTDTRCNPATVRMIEALGSRVHVVTEPDPVDGYLGARLRHVRDLVRADDRHVWLNQYENAANWQAHYRTTAPAIADRFPALDVLFVGAGTTGTLMGCARYFHERRPGVTVVAVDSVGSVTFGGPPLMRFIPGLGAGVRPPMLDLAQVDDVVQVTESDAIDMCHRLARKGFLFGGSTGTVVTGAARWLADHGARQAVAIAPDLGDRYVDSVYEPSWVREVTGRLDAVR